MYTGRYVEGVYRAFYSCGMVPYMYTVGILGGACKVCIRNFTVVAGFFIVSVHISVYIIWRINRYTECGVEEMCTDFMIYLVNNDPWFLVGMKFICWNLRARVLGIQISDLKTLHN